ncbi:protein kinase [Lachnospiraceae bacterium 62-35]
MNNDTEKTVLLSGDTENILEAEKERERTAVSGEGIGDDERTIILSGNTGDDGNTVLLSSNGNRGIPGSSIEDGGRTVLLGSGADGGSDAFLGNGGRNDGSTVLLGSGMEDGEHTVLLGNDGMGAQQFSHSSGEQPGVRPDYSAGEVRDWAGQAKGRCPNCMKVLKAEARFCPNCGFQMGTKPKEIYHLHPGMVLADRYMVGTVLGFGGFGITYRAWDNKLNVMVAIKEYYPVGIVNRIPGEKEVILYTGKSRKEFMSGLDRFLEEARNTVRFSNHPNIVNVFDFFEENGTAYIIMEFLDGISIKDYLKRVGGRLSSDEAVKIVCAIMEALKQVHGAGILHRDISPDNIFLCNDGKIKLIDFGAARFSTGEEEKTMSIVLKMGYAPPEQYRSKSRQGPWTDIYALGATLYRMVSGKVPDESVNRVVEDKVPEPRLLEPSVPDYLSKAIMRAMALTPEFRFQSIGEFQEAILNRTKVLGLEEDIRRRKRRRALGVAGAFLVLLGAAGAAGMVYQSKRAEAFLAKADVSIWIPVREGRTEDEEKDIFREMAAEFAKDYPDITFQVSFIPEEEYDDQVEEALESGKLPSMFESSGLPEDSLSKAAEPLSDILERLDWEEYYFLNQYEDYFPDKKQMPLGFQAGVLYGNSKKLDSLSFPKKNDEQGFLDGDTAVYAGSTELYHKVQDTLSGLYLIKAMPGEEAPGCFDGLWSVSKSASKAEKRAAERFLYYYLSEKGQEVLHIDNRGAIPLIKSQAEVYLEVNGELSFVKDEIKNMNMVSPGDMTQECDKLYQKLYKDKENMADYLKDMAEER